MKEIKCDFLLILTTADWPLICWCTIPRSPPVLMYYKRQEAKVLHNFQCCNKTNIICNLSCFRSLLPEFAFSIICF